MAATLAQFAAVMREVWRGDWLVERIDNWLIEQHEPIETFHSDHPYVCGTCNTASPCDEYWRLIEVRHRHRAERDMAARPE
jgi:hypothetical protein